MKSTADPDVPNLAGRDRNRRFLLHALNQLDHLVRGLFTAEDRFVADHQAVHVAMAPSGLDRVADLTLVAGLVLVDPRADGRLQAKFVGDPGNEVEAVGRRIGADRLGIGRHHLHVGADLLDRRTLAFVGVVGPLERRERHAGQRAIHVRRGGTIFGDGPDAGVKTSYERDDEGGEAHGRNQLGRGHTMPDPSPGTGTDMPRRNISRLAFKKQLIPAHGVLRAAKTNAKALRASVTCIMASHLFSETEDEHLFRRDPARG
jgi:hypothetical protein